MAKNKDIDQFLKDAKQAAKLAGSQLPVVKDVLSAHETYETIQRLRESTPKAKAAAKRELLKRIKKQRQKIRRKTKSKFRGL